MNNSIIWMIIGMGLATYIPRLLPFVLFKGKELPPFWQGVLKNIPFATLGALIFPAVLFIQDNVLYGLLGAASAFLLSYLGLNVIISVLGSIVVLTVYSSFV
ncbi:AzlD domain-containing protein [Peribacillus deserti]|uniref:Branched-chain amino acid transporter n=1 Tax=Peribacillus deserti TaxID=673318 RepID=A0A2N5M021_9BACI|nr:AzlD domain-containing protein [Peribacillus deserti]PLT27716.1 branched-chain amino acid transporter [Peribacillus deserti]